jgi:hypothetical protein
MLQLTWSEVNLTMKPGERGKKLLITKGEFERWSGKEDLHCRPPRTETHCIKNDSMCKMFIIQSRCLAIFNRSISQ